MTRTLTLPSDVHAVLADDAFDVVPAPPGSSGLPWLRSTVSRFSTGPDHARRRALACRELEACEPGALRALARGRTKAALGAGERLDVMPLARGVVVASLAEALGAPATVAEDVCAIASAYASGESSPAVDAAVEGLRGVFGGDELGAARIGLLVQACDATGALAGNALALGFAAAAPDVDALLAETLRRDPPVLVTRRVGPDETVVLQLSGDGGSLAFGAGLRPCPGRAQALALAAGVVEPVLRRYRLAGELRYASSPNLRVLERLEVEVR